MAGIGFELKKLFLKEGIINRIKAYIYASFVTIGPFMMCTAMITIVQILIKHLGISYGTRQLFLAIVVYAFVFSQIIVSGMSMMVTRYIADMLFEKRNDKILPAFFGVSFICLIFGSILVFAFYWNSPISIYIKLLSYILFSLLIIMWLEGVFLTALKDYSRIMRGYLIGMITIILLVFIGFVFTNIDRIIVLLLALDIGILIVVSILIAALKQFFDNKKIVMLFDFIKYFDWCAILFFVNILYTFSIYVHNFVFWSSNLKVVIQDTFVFAPIYDVPTFYAFLSIMGSMVLFVVSVETRFYEKYRGYYSLVMGNGTFREIERARRDMRRTIFSEITRVLQFQLVLSILAIIIGNVFLPQIGLTYQSIDIFNMLVLGAFANVVILIVMLILLYFEDRLGALLVALLFFMLNLTLSQLSISFGEDYYGTGFFAAAFITAIVSIWRLGIFLKHIHHHTFLSQPVIAKEKEGVFTRFINYMYRKC